MALISTKAKVQSQFQTIKVLYQRLPCIFGRNLLWSVPLIPTMQSIKTWLVIKGYTRSVRERKAQVLTPRSWAVGEACSSKYPTSCDIVSTSRYNYIEYSPAINHLENSHPTWSLLGNLIGWYFWGWGFIGSFKSEHASQGQKVFGLECGFYPGGL